MLEFKFDQSKGIVVVIRSGDVDLKDLLSFVLYFDDHHQDLKRIFILDVYHNSTSKFRSKDFGPLNQAIKDRIDRYEIVFHAAVVDKPLDTALSMFFELLSHTISKYEYKTFSSKDAALLWLQKMK